MFSENTTGKTVQEPFPRACPPMIKEIYMMSDEETFSKLEIVAAFRFSLDQTWCGPVLNWVFAMEYCNELFPGFTHHDWSPP
jgi:hypothetical protein